MHSDSSLRHFMTNQNGWLVPDVLDLCRRHQANPSFLLETSDRLQQTPPGPAQEASLPDKGSHKDGSKGLVSPSTALTASHRQGAGVPCRQTENWPPPYPIIVLKL